MTYTGHMQDGVVVFDGPAPPDGAAVRVEPAANGAPAPESPVINPRTGQPYPSYFPREVAEALRRRELGEEPDEPHVTFAERYQNVIGAVDDPNLPTDGALNHDHYLYGRPKKS